jgi:ribosomal protein L11 methyltransferase
MNRKNPLKSFGCGTMLRIYEIKGSGRPRNLPAEGLDGIWPEPPFYYLFYRKESAEPVLEWLKSCPDWRLTARYDLPYDKWQDISTPQIGLGSFNIRLTADPAAALLQGAAPPPSSPAAEGLSGQAGCGPSAGIAILIDPGVVFGSGLHPTTQGCLLAISEIFGSNEIHTALDFGAGTGILAIACVQAGAKFVLAIDRNPLALKIAWKNALANGVADRIALVEADRLGCLSIGPDFFVMNLEWPILEKTLAAGEWRNARRVVLAGFLGSKLESVKAFARPEFQVDGVIERQGWPTVTLSRT